MADMSKADAELAYRYLNDAMQSDVESEAYTEALDAWAEDRPDDLADLKAAHDDPDSSFAWENIYFETDPAYDGDLVPITGVEHTEEPETRDLASDFAWDYLASIRNEIRDVQEGTDYSPREFVALVLDAAENTPEDLAHREMDISLGNYRGKKGMVAEKYKRAQHTISVTERIRA